MTISDTGFLILMGLAQSPRRPQHGYALIQAINQHLGRDVLLPAALYTTLPKLLKDSLVEEVEPPADNTDARRRFYKLTDKGVKVVVEKAQEEASMARMILALPNMVKGAL